MNALESTNKESTITDPRFEGLPKMHPAKMLGAMMGTLLSSLFVGGAITFSRIIARRQAAGGQEPFVSPVLYEHFGNIGPTIMALGATATVGIIWRLARTGGVSTRWEHPLRVAATLSAVGVGLNAVAELAPEALQLLPVIFSPTDHFNTVASAGFGDLIAGTTTSVVVAGGVAYANRPGPVERAIFNAEPSGAPTQAP